ncbi:MAG: phosphatidylglycerophosphatase A family protein [Burkholderiales bacterium]
MTTSVDLASRVSWNFVRAHPAHFIAFGFGAGLAHVAPGSFGALLAFPFFWLLQPALSSVQFLALLAALFLLGIWACAVTGKALGIADYSGMVWDETVAFLLVLFFVPPALTWQGLAFLFFRLFDIFKPFPIRTVERKVAGGLGVMLDDLLAAFYTLFVLAVLKAFVN